MWGKRPLQPHTLPAPSLAPGMSASSDADTLREGSASPHLPQHHADQVDVAEAEAVFHALERRLTIESQKRSLHRDAEKGGEDDGVFNLRDYLQSSNDAQQAAGIKHKHVGVFWEDMQVNVFGGIGFKVSGVGLLECFPLTLNLRRTLPPSIVRPLYASS